ncbi:hypothetical protein RRG08_014672 [Elysia crispata]|uniref:Uncharacterized protein n=1 Tax=Elysia crispata TaxID=231223 RepID=A0AAE0YHZ2_9GAST|nr:hypothetical protein RRG08_014672 [Elysia crispata]
MILPGPNRGSKPGTNPCITSLNSGEEREAIRKRLGASCIPQADSEDISYPARQHKHGLSSSPALCPVSSYCPGVLGRVSTGATISADPRLTDEGLWSCVRKSPRSWSASEHRSGSRITKRVNLPPVEQKINIAAETKNPSQDLGDVSRRVFNIPVLPNASVNEAIMSVAAVLFICSAPSSTACWK